MYYYDENKIMMTMLLIYFAVLAVIGIVALASYLLQGFGMYTMGKRRGISAPGLAFVPYARVYFQGELCGPLHFNKRTMKSPGIWLLVVPIVFNVVFGLFFALLWGAVMVRIVSAVDTMQYGGSMEFFRGFGGGVLLIGLVIFCVVCILVSAAIQTLTVLVNQQIYSRYTHKNLAIMHAVLGLFVPLYTAIYFFAIRNRDLTTSDGPDVPEKQEIPSVFQPVAMDALPVEHEPAAEDAPVAENEPSVEDASEQENKNEE